MSSPGMDEAAANTVAALILAEDQHESASGIAVVHKLVHNGDREGQEMQSARVIPGLTLIAGQALNLRPLGYEGVSSSLTHSPTASLPLAIG